jgi:hypothetical protein
MGQRFVVNGTLTNLRRYSLFVLDDSEKEFSMSKFAIGEKVDNAADDHEVGMVIAVFPTVDGSFRYAVDTEGYGALQFFTEEKLVVHPG